MAETGGKTSVKNQSTVEHRKMARIFHHDEMSTYAECYLPVLRVGVGLGLSFSRSNRVRVLCVIGRFCEACSEE